MSDDGAVRYVYSVVRAVPEPKTGEYVNIAAIAGSEITGEWSVRQVQNDRRARALGGSADVLTAVYAFLARVGDQIDLHDWAVDETEREALGDYELTESWLHDLHRRSRNVVQLSAPAPVVAANAEEALDLIFESIVLDPVSRHRENLTKHRVYSALRVAYLSAGLKLEDLRKRVTLVAGSEGRFTSPIDFVVANGRAVQLAHTWSFQGINQATLLQEVKAWGWTVRELKEAGGLVLDAAGERLDVPKDVALEVVFIPPREDSPAPAYREARAVFEELEVNAVALGREREVGLQAKKLLRDLGGHTTLI